MGKIRTIGSEKILKQFYEDGKRHGAKSRLGRALGQSRATVDAWERLGIPLKYAEQLKKLTGLEFGDIWKVPS